MQQLTEKQRQVLEFVSSCLEVRACPPTLREIAGHINTRGTATAILHLDALERKGYIRRSAGSSRSIAVVGRGGSISLPVIGRVKAGPPALACEEIEGYCSVDLSWAEKGCFLLRVSGDSMRDDHILNGDLALIRPQSSADDGDIVVAMVGGDEATLKRFYREEAAGRIRLEARNPDYPSYVVSPEDVTIIGRLITTIRTYP